MSYSDLLTDLKNIYFFENIDDDILKELSTQLKPISLSQGEMLFKEGEHGDALYIVLNGRSNSYSGRRKAI